MRAPGAATAQLNHSWQNFPRFLLAFLLVVVIVNVRFIVLAVNSFPGVATRDDFDTSNRYNAILKSAETQAALGWSERASAQGDLAVLDLLGGDGRKLAGARISAQAERPLGTAATVALGFRETAPGHYVADAPLSLPGQWMLNLHVRVQGKDAYVTRRIVID